MQPCLKPCRAREHANSFALLEPVSSFRLNHAALFRQIRAILVDRGGGNPHLPDCDPILALALGGVAQFEECRRPAEMVRVQMSERNNIVRIAPGALQVSAQLLLKIDTLVRGVVGIPRIGVVDQDLPASSQIDTTTVRVAKRKHGDGMHEHLEEQARPEAPGKTTLCPRDATMTAHKHTSSLTAGAAQVIGGGVSDTRDSFLQSLRDRACVATLSASPEMMRSPIAWSLAVSQSPTTTLLVKV